MIPSPIHATFAMSRLHHAVAIACEFLAQLLSGVRSQRVWAELTGGFGDPNAPPITQHALAIVEARQRGGHSSMGNPAYGATEDADVTLADVERAARVIEGAVLETDCDRSRTLSEMLGCELWLKFENLQFTASFKERGALNCLAALAPQQPAAGVIAMSAGNHAQGVAYHARRLGIGATIVMPLGTPVVKIENTKRHGAEVIVTGATLEEAAHYA